MKIQKGLVKYKDRSDIVCTYGITDEGKQYYFINDRKLSNNNIIVTSALVEAIDHSVVPANIGVINSDGNIVIDCVNKSIKLITKDILLVEKANPTSPSVVEALKNRKDPLAATKLVSNSAAIKEKMTTQMGSDARFIFNDQFSEASLFDISGKNLLNDKYYSFIALNKRGDTIYLSDNVQTSGVDSLSLTSMQFNDTTNVDASIPSNLSSDNKLDVTDASVNKENIDNAMNENITKLGDDTVSDVPPVVDDDPAVPEIPAVPEVPEDSSIESAPSVPVGVVVPPMNAVSEEAKEETNEVPAANEEKVEEKTEARKEDNEDGYTAIPAKAIDEMNDGEVPTSIDSVVDTSIEKEDASESTNNNETEVDSQDKEEIKEEDSTEETSEDKEETEEKADDVEEPKEDVSADDLLAGLTGTLDVKDETSDESNDVEDKSTEESKEEMEELIMTQGFKKARFKILQLLMKLRQICIDPTILYSNYKKESIKFEKLIEVVQDYVSEGHKILIFSSFKKVIDKVKVMFNKEKITSYTIAGDVKSKTRMELVEKFNKDDTNCFLITLGSGGTGLNLTSADVVIHLDIWWNPQAENQATDRAHRIGQKNKVEVIKLISTGTIEEKILELQNKKKLLSDKVIEGDNRGENLISKLSAKDIKNLLSFENKDE